MSLYRDNPNSNSSFYHLGAFCLPVLQITWETLKSLHEKKEGGKNKASSSGGK